MFKVVFTQRLNTRVNTRVHGRGVRVQHLGMSRMKKCRRWTCFMRSWCSGLYDTSLALWLSVASAGVLMRWESLLCRAPQRHGSHSSVVTTSQGTTCLLCAQSAGWIPLSVLSSTVNLNLTGSYVPYSSTSVSLLFDRGSDGSVCGDLSVCL